MINGVNPFKKGSVKIRQYIPSHGCFYSFFLPQKPFENPNEIFTKRISTPSQIERTLVRIRLLFNPRRVF
ncbi:hypothetical protein HZS_1797 [Henneguya salminicola]|nr:hypothetical protein HZS_1797 [Henneguya salminicola]